jgi:hypothetical protein
MPFRSIAHQLIVILVCLVWPSLDVLAQDPSPASAKPDQPLLTSGELDALVAPIALYPDALLADVLMAATYPLEVVQAERWVRSKKLKEDQLKAEADKQPWDKSIKELAATPAVLELMSEQLNWTERLGNAVLAQQADVMAAVQRLRSKAYDNKKLISTKEQTVTVAQADDRLFVTIAPATSDVISVPYYDPAVAYAPWPYSDAPPYYFAAPDYIPAGFIASGIAFGAGYFLGRWTDGDNYWGGGIRWDKGDLTVNRPINIDRDRVSHWQHNPGHRHGVEYTHANVRQKFANTDGRPGLEARDQLRGNRDTAQKSKSNRPGAADRDPTARKSATVKGGKKSAPKRSASSKGTASKATRRAAGQTRAHASARAHTSARPSGQPRVRQPGVQPRPATRASAARSRPGYAAFSGRGPARSFGGGGFRGGGRGRR